AFPNLHDRSIGVSAHVQIGLGQKHAFGPEAQRCVERALHAAQGNKRRSHEQGAESDLNTEEKIAKSETTKNDRASPPALHHLRGVCRPDLRSEERRVGKDGKSEL